MKISPNILITNKSSMFPVAGPIAAKTNIKNPDKNRLGSLYFFMITIPAMISGITVPKVMILLIVTAQAALVSAIECLTLAHVVTNEKSRLKA